jgi:hypothetical protein
MLQCVAHCFRVFAVFATMEMGKWFVACRQRIYNVGRVKGSDIG